MIKTFAEWDKQELLMLALPHAKTDWSPYLDDILNSYETLIRVVSEFERILLIAPEERDFERFAKIKNVEFTQIATNDTWIRDYGAIDVWQDNKAISYDFTFNAWGEKFSSSLDNEVNKKLFTSRFDSELKSVDLVLEGGSIDFNGRGDMLTTSECLLNSNRGRRDKSTLERELKELFGLKNIIWLNHGFIKGDDTDSHVDTLARFIAPDTVAYAACNDKSDEHFDELNAMRMELENTGLNLIPLYLPKKIEFSGKRLPATYCNFIFINNALIVPTYGDADADEHALSDLREALPNLNIIGVNSRIFIRQNGSLHCSSQNRFKAPR